LLMLRTCTTRRIALGSLLASQLQVGAAAVRRQNDRSVSSKPGSSYIVGSSTFTATGLSPPNEDELPRWHALGGHLLQSLGSEVTEKQVQRAYHLVLPVYFFLDTLRKQSRRQHEGDRTRRPPLLIGLQCLQGGGKTTICDQISELFRLEGLNCVVASIDDFYRTHAELEQLKASHPTELLLHGRGAPGTHDMPLMSRVMSRLRDGESGERVSVPRYDKSAHSGAGDRRPESEWSTCDLPVDVIILEGWCLGFEPTAASHTEASQQAVPPHLRLIDGELRSFASLYEMLDGFVIIQATDVNLVYVWREEAEEKLRAAGAGAMTKEQVRAFVDRYMRMYEQYLQPMYERGGPLPPDRTLQFCIDSSRLPTTQPNPADKHQQADSTD